MSGRIGIVTFWRLNYGSILQCYATKRYIESKGYEAVLISEEPQTKAAAMLRKLSKGFTIIRNTAISRDYLANYLDVRKAGTKSLLKLTDETKQLMDDFSYDFLRPVPCSRRVLKKKSREDDYVAFFAGSDQIWNGSRAYNGLYFLEFAPSEKRVAWAPSFGFNNIESYNLKRFKKAISDFACLSAREKSGAQLIGNLCGRQATLLPDPVILMSRVDWLTFSKQGLKLTEGFVLLHFLDRPNRLAIDAIKAIRNEEPIRFVTFACRYAELDELEFVEYIDITPFDYVSLINDAAMVLTDSFHTSLFSIIMQTEFLVFERQYLHGFSEESRKTDLLDAFDLRENYVYELSAANICKCDGGLQIKDTERTLQEFRQRADAYFATAMGEVESN